MKKHPVLRALGLGLLLAAPAGQAEPGPAAPAELARLSEQTRAITRYACTMQSFNRRDAESNTKTVRFTWARGGRVRMEVLEGPDQGSVLTRDAAGQIRGRKGGFLKMISVTLKDDDARVVNLRGRKFYEADWASVVAEVEARAAGGWTLQAQPDETIDGQVCAVLELTSPAGQPVITRDRLWIDRARGLLLRRQQFEGNTRINEVRWRDLDLQPAADDALFTL